MSRFLGQHIEAGDVIWFPRKNRLTQPYWAEVSRVVGLRAYAKDGNSVQLPYDDHVTVIDGAYSRANALASPFDEFPRDIKPQEAK